MGVAVASTSTDLPEVPCAIRASLSLRLGFSLGVERELLLVSVELGVDTFSVMGVEFLSGTAGDCRGSGEEGEGFSVVRGNEGTGGVVPSCDISMSGFESARGREPDVALEAELPGRGGRTSVASGASSESSDDEWESSSESQSRARDLLRTRPADDNRYYYRRNGLKIISRTRRYNRRLHSLRGSYRSVLSYKLRCTLSSSVRL
jgi:hypothetical protein